MTEQDRKAFEAWAASDRVKLNISRNKRDDKFYWHYDTNISYMAWQAALATRPDVFSEEKFQAATKTLGEHDEFSCWSLDEGELRSFAAKCVAPTPDVNQELVEALGKYGSCLVSCASVPFTNKNCTCGFKQALAKHKAGDNLSPTEKPSLSEAELMEDMSVAIAEKLLLIPNGTTWEDKSEILAKTAITSLKAAGALRLKGE